MRLCCEVFFVPLQPQSEKRNSKILLNHPFGKNGPNG